MSCHNDSICLHEYLKMIVLKGKRYLFGAEKLKWFLLFIGIRNMSVNKTFTHVQEQKKRCRRDILLTFCLVKLNPQNIAWGIK